MFIVSKLFTVLLNPVLWIVVIFLWGILTKKEKRKTNCFRAGIFMLFFFSNPFIINKLILSYQEKNMQLHRTKYTVQGSYWVDFRE